MSTTVLDTPPTVSLASLPASVSGTQILTANASDTQSGIASVQFLARWPAPRDGHGGALQFSWNTTSVSPIQHTLTAIATRWSREYGDPAYRDGHRTRHYIAGRELASLPPRFRDADPHRQRD